MTAITIREVPPETVKALKLRAVQAGQSLQAYLLDMLNRSAWEDRARSDMERLRDEDLSDEPDAWEYSEDGGTRLTGEGR